MLDPAIDGFFAERKKAWLKENINASMTEEEKGDKKRGCEEIFALKNWLPSAARPVRYVHPPCYF